VGRFPVRSNRKNALPSLSVVAQDLWTAGRRSLTQEVIEEAVDFRQVWAGCGGRFADKKDRLFEPWNVETVKNLSMATRWHLRARRRICSAQPRALGAPGDCNSRGCCIRRQMARVRQHSPGDREDGKAGGERGPNGVSERMVNRFGCGIVPTRVTDFQVMLLPAA